MDLQSIPSSDEGVQGHEQQYWDFFWINWNQLSGVFLFTDDYLLILPPFIQLHRDISVTFTDVTSAKNKVQLKNEYSTLRSGVNQCSLIESAERCWFTDTEELVLWLQIVWVNCYYHASSGIWWLYKKKCVIHWNIWAFPARESAVPGNGQ